MEAYMATDEREGAWLALSQEMGESLLDVERAFLTLVDSRGASLASREQAVRMYLAAWSRLRGAHRLLAHYLLN